MSYLLDTHALIWLAGDWHERSPQVEAAITAPGATVAASAVSAFEIATKVRLGKLDQARPLADHWDQRIREFGATELPISARHGRIAGSLAWEHRDPFDRLLVAQAMSENLTLITADSVVLTASDVSLLEW